MDSDCNHWGEFEDVQNGAEDWTLSFTDLEDLLHLQPTRPSPPSLFQPSQEDTASFQILAPEMCRSDPLVLQTIRLLQHQRQLLQLIARAESYGIDVNSSLPAFPEDPPIERKSAKQQYLNFLPSNNTSFTEGASKGQKIQIEASTSRLILRKAVATIFAHAGYTDTSESVLRVMTDVCHDFVSKFTSLLRSNTDEMLLKDASPFHDVVEQTLHNMGFAGMASLHSHYKDRIVGYHYRVRQRTLQLHHQYQNQMFLANAAAAANTSILATSLRREPTVQLSLGPSATIPTITGDSSISLTSSEEAGLPPPMYQLHIPNNSTPIVVQTQSTSIFDDSANRNSIPNVIESEGRAFSVLSQSVNSGEDNKAATQSILFSATTRL